MIRTVYFDIDDTIYDRSMPFRAACALFFPEPLKDVYYAYLRVKARGDEVFLPAQRGEISMEEMYIYRICRGFADAGIPLTAAEALHFQEHYRTMQGRITMTDTMHQILSYCRESFPQLGLITNGPSDKQRGKIRALGLEAYFPEERILISGECGLDKPDPRLYRLAQNRCGSRAEEILYIGDSRVHDVDPALSLGWKVIWFNRCGDAPAPDAPVPAAVVGSEEQLLEILPDFAVQRHPDNKVCRVPGRADIHPE